jgi:methionyl-tRNA formyltransferase
VRLIFMGTPDFAVPALRALHAGHEVAAVFTRAPKPAGRGQDRRPSPVAVASEALGLPVFTPASLRGMAGELAALRAELAVVAAYGLILPADILAAPRLGCLNIHASLLPRWRGAAPIQRAIMAGDRESGVSIMQMEAGLDSGPVLLRRAIRLDPAETAGSLHDRLAVLGAELIVETLAGLPGLRPVPQDEGAVTWAPKISKSEAILDWRKPAAELDATIRGLSPFPGAWTMIGGRRVKLLSSRLAGSDGPCGTVGRGPGLMINCGEGAVAVTRLQREGKGPMDATEFLRGTRISPGSMLDS